MSNSKYTKALYRPILYKEWLKLRLIIIISTLTMVALSLFCVYKLHRIIELKGAQHIWTNIMTRGAIFVNILYCIPLVIGITLTIFQFLPETTFSRIKLMLHLPCKTTTSIGTMIIFGQGVMFLEFLLSLGIIYFGFLDVLAIELVHHIVLTIIPWYLIGMIAYAFGAFIFLEPSWKRRVYYLIISTLTIRVFFLSTKPEAYNNFIIPMVICLILWSMLPILSISRIQNGNAS